MLRRRLAGLERAGGSFAAGGHANSLVNDPLPIPVDHIAASGYEGGFLFGDASMPRRQLNLESLEAREVPAAKLQLIHNSPFAAAKVVDVYVNDNLLLDNF